MQLGFLDRTPRGRTATERAFEYFKVAKRAMGGAQNTLF
jgi:Holliday junction resolvasome RuvABC ATP-dependent DNA helicase subunit